MKHLYLTIILMLGLFQICRGQHKAFDLNVVTKFINKSSDNTTFNVSTTFNKTKGPTAQPVFIHAGKINRRKKQLLFFGIKPTFEANIGSDAKSSPNNIVTSVVFHFVPENLSSFNSGDKGHSSLFADLSPVAVADKDFDTGLFYGNAAVGRYNHFSRYRQKKDSILQTATFLYSLAYHNGKRFIENDEENLGGYFHRLMPNLYGEINFYNHSKKKNIINLKVDYQHYFVYNDEFLDEGDGDRDFPNFTGTVSYTLPFKESDSASPSFQNFEVRINLKYFYGYEEPVFEELSTLTYGLGMYVKL